MSAKAKPDRPASGRYRYLFGPVPSRRLGRSLGIDLVPRKTCSFNCVFCQVGRSNTTTLERKEYVPVEEVLREFEHWSVHDGRADAATLSGSGEPTLHARFGDVLKAVRRFGRVRTVLLTNSSLLHVPQVRADAALADIVKVSLSAWDQASFRKINRAHKDLSLEKILEGLRLFRPLFKGELWLEVFVLAETNESREAMCRVAELAKSFSPDRVHLNTVVRPPAETSALPVAREVLEGFASIFTPKAEVIADFKPRKDALGSSDKRRVEAMLTRRPCTAKEVAGGLGVLPEQVSVHLDELVRRGRIRICRRGRSVYYQATGQED